MSVYGASATRDRHGWFLGLTGTQLALLLVAAAPVWLAMALPSLCARRLRDAGLGRSQALFLLLIPPIGWPGLACLLTRPTRDRPTNDGRC